ncbi:hypothetical protein [Pedobacter sp. GR22-6]|uniref:hypothetical protein n=1 Tax=Pedobacter sp. GR22-6 TaxID=3127957 RepID=UPI00307F587C
MKHTTLSTVQPDPGLPGGDPDVPLDGALLLILMIAGAIYGLRKIRSMKYG